MKKSSIFIPIFVILLTAVLFPYKAGSTGIEPEVEKITIKMEKGHAEAERLFNFECGKCHKVPDVAKPGFGCSCCTRGLAPADLARIRDYMADVRTGEKIYGSYCGRCHALIDPKSHTLDYWEKNFCTSNGCMVKRQLTKEEDQQILLYLSSRAIKGRATAKTGTLRHH